MFVQGYNSDSSVCDRLTEATRGDARKVKADLEDLRTLLRSEGASPGRIEALERAIRFISALR